jgi:ribA/ribD-fused uncharacterized protein
MEGTKDQIRSVKELIQFTQTGKRVKYVFFWGHRQQQSGHISKSCLSNWYPAPFTVKGILYPTTEHYMMAQKALLFEDTATYTRILKAKTPGEAKKLGRSVQGFDEDTWTQHRVEIVVQGNEAKFSQHDALKTYLLSTQERILVEASPRDRIWGIGMAADDPHIENPNAWNGLNLLGFALMEVRSRLQKQKR